MQSQLSPRLVVRFVCSKREYYRAGEQWMDLNDLRELQGQGIPLAIRDRETGEDITRIVLA
jgi:polyhydroxyalkanoate synthesis regulator protein